MLIKIAKIDYSENLIAVITQEYKDETADIHDPQKLASEIQHLLYNEGVEDDDGREALKIAAAILRNIADLFAYAPEFSTITLGQLEDVAEQASPRGTGGEQEAT